MAPVLENVVANDPLTDVDYATYATYAPGATNFESTGVVDAEQDRYSLSRNNVKKHT